MNERSTEMTDNQNNQIQNGQNQNPAPPPQGSGMYDGWLSGSSGYTSFSDKPKEAAVYSKWESIGAILLYLLAFLFCRSLTSDGGYLAIFGVCILTLSLTAAHVIFKKPQYSFHISSLEYSWSFS